MNVSYAPTAVADLSAAYDHIARHNPAAAARVVGRLVDTIKGFVTAGVQGRPVVLKDGTPMLGWVILPYRVYYRVYDEGIEIARVYHHARAPLER